MKHDISRHTRRAACLVAVAAAGLAGCGHVPVATIWTLARTDTMAIDPAGVRVAVRYRDVLRPRAGGARLTLETWRAGGSERNKVEFVLVEEKQGAAVTRIGQHARPGDALTVFRLSDEDAKRMRDIQRDHRAAVEGGAKRGGNLSAGVDACRTAALPDGPLPASTWLMLDPAQGFMPIVEDVDLKREIGDRLLETQLPPC